MPISLVDDDAADDDNDARMLRASARQDVGGVWGGIIILGLLGSVQYGVSTEQQQRNGSPHKQAMSMRFSSCCCEVNQ